MLSTVMWVGKGTVFVVGLSVVLAAVFGVAATAFAANGKPFLLGRSNVATAVSTLVKKGAGPALDLRVGSGPPLRVNSPALVSNLNADRVDGKNAGDFAASAHNHDDRYLGKNDKAADSDTLDGRDSASFADASHSHDERYFTKGESDGRYLSKNGKAADADRLDGMDSRDFMVKTNHAAVLAHECDTPSVWNECAPITVVVPQGKRYIVSVWSSFSARDSGGAGSFQSVDYCSGGKGPSIDAFNPCVTPFGVSNRVAVHDYLIAASSSGDTVALDPGTYTFFTAIKPFAREFNSAAPGSQVITKVMARDAANNL